MALTKTVEYDKTEIIGDYKAVQCREATIVKEDGVELSRSFNRHVLHPSRIVVGGAENEDGQWINDGTFTHVDTDVSGEPQETQDVCAAVWTDAVKAAWQAKQELDFS
jgi:hypothetical protein